MTDLRDVERDSIRRFVQQAASEGYFSGQVLDFGCGKQPYRDIIESIKPFGGPVYQPFDQADFPANVSGENVGEGDPLWVYGWGAILCTQVIQYISNVEWHLRRFRESLRSGGYLVMTYPTNWPEVEPEDLHRFTKAGMERLLTEAGFTIVMHRRRASFTHPHLHGGDEFALGYGVVCRA